MIGCAQLLTLFLSHFAVSLYAFFPSAVGLHASLYTRVDRFSWRQDPPAPCAFFLRFSLWSAPCPPRAPIPREICPPPPPISSTTSASVGPFYDSSNRFLPDWRVCFHRRRPLTPKLLLFFPYNRTLDPPCATFFGSQPLFPGGTFLSFFLFQTILPLSAKFFFPR